MGLRKKPGFHKGRTFDIHFGMVDIRDVMNALRFGKLLSLDFYVYEQASRRRRWTSRLHVQWGGGGVLQGSGEALDSYWAS